MFVHVHFLVERSLIANVQLLIYTTNNNKPLCRDYELEMRAQKYSAYLIFGPIVP